MLFWNELKQIKLNKIVNATVSALVSFTVILILCFCFSSSSVIADIVGILIILAFIFGPLLLFCYGFAEKMRQNEEFSKLMHNKDHKPLWTSQNQGQDSQITDTKQRADKYQF